MKSEDKLPITINRSFLSLMNVIVLNLVKRKKNLTRKFKKYYQFGFTGTPIFPENALGKDTTKSVFGSPLHSYIITDAIRDEKVLKFKVDYNDVRPQFKSIETEKNLEKLTALEKKQAFFTT